MNTDELIGLLAADPRPARPPPSTSMGIGMLLGAAGATALVVAILGINPDIGAELRLPAFWAKEAFCAALTLTAALASLRLARPGVALGRVGWAALLIVAAYWGLAAIELADAAAGERGALLLGRSWRVCTLRIAGFELPALVGLLWAARQSAPTRLRLAGAAAGGAAGGIGALAYSLHCPELAAPFVGLWYLLGILSPAVAGAVLGPALLRW